VSRLLRVRVPFGRNIHPPADGLHLASMDPFRELGRTLLVLGAVLVVAGSFFYFGGKLPFRLGRLPGDIVQKGEHTTF
jgi:Protein of unknown function (DUF2905)